ncbi:MAG TPA: hypothetical protein VG275_05120 [Solirubrobacteraceae bacterium]|nr:hypothetical protein [Solirubrobacteraceae bacterium]
MSRRRLGAIPGRSGRRPLPPATTDVTATFPWCLEQGVDTRPHYLWGTLLAVRIAAALGLPSVAAVEFGVAGGNGLLALERAAAAAAELSGVEVEVWGFDIGSGMPAPVDPRDAPWLIEPGWFAMDEDALRARLTRAQLVLGPVAETVAAFADTEHAPIGFIAFDLDYYSATRDAFGVLEGAPERLLPRIPSYFDDVFGYGWSEFTGERAAIAEFNAAHAERKIGKIHGMRYSLPPAQQPLAWHEQMYLIHLFDHPEYSTSEGPLAEGWLAAHRLAPEG